MNLKMALANRFLWMFLVLPISGFAQECDKDDLLCKELKAKQTPSKKEDSSYDRHRQGAAVDPNYCEAIKLEGVPSCIELKSDIGFQAGSSIKGLDLKAGANLRNSDGSVMDLELGVWGLSRQSGLIISYQGVPNALGRSKKYELQWKTIDGVHRMSLGLLPLSRGSDSSQIHIGGSLGRISADLNDDHLKSGTFLSADAQAKKTLAKQIDAFANVTAGAVHGLKANQLTGEKSITPIVQMGVQVTRALPNRSSVVFLGINKSYLAVSGNSKVNSNSTSGNSSLNNSLTASQKIAPLTLNAGYRIYFGGHKNRQDSQAIR